MWADKGLRQVACYCETHQTHNSIEKQTQDDNANGSNHKFVGRKDYSGLNLLKNKVAEIFEVRL